MVVQASLWKTIPRAYIAISDGHSDRVVQRNRSVILNRLPVDNRMNGSQKGCPGLVMEHYHHGGGGQKALIHLKMEVEGTIQLWTAKHSIILIDS